MFTKREIDYFANLGEMLGFDAFIEDSKFDKSKGRSRPMDLSWWKWDARIDDENFLYLTLHLEREFISNKDVETIEKLFSDTEESYIPHNVIGIQYIESADRIDYLNDLILQRNMIQQSNCLMIYRYYDSNLDLERVCAYTFTPKGLNKVRNAICNQDDSATGIFVLMKTMYRYKIIKESLIQLSFKKINGSLVRMELREIKGAKQKDLCKRFFYKHKSDPYYYP